MDDTVERVAEAIYVAYATHSAGGGPGRPWRSLAPFEKAFGRKLAEAAIEALQETQAVAS